MGRAQGKHPPRGGGIVADLEGILGVSASDRPQTPGEQREEGIGDERDIPGGLTHIANPETAAPPGYAKPSEWRYRKDLAHGVDPDEAGHHDREQHASPRGGQSGHPKLEGEAAGPYPVPVYIVELAGGRKAKATAAMRRITLPAAGSEPVTIAPQSFSRTLVQVLNEDTTHNARIGGLEDLTYDAQNAAFYGGARLPAAATGYLVFRSKEQVFGISETSSPVVISVILEDEIRDAL